MCCTRLFNWKRTAREARRLRRAQPVVPQRLAGVHGHVALAVQVEGPGAQEVSARKGHAVVAFVGIFEARLGVHGRVGQRCRLGLAALEIVVQLEVVGGQDARVAVGEVDGQGLALGDAAWHLPVGGSDAEAVRAVSAVAQPAVAEPPVAESSATAAPARRGLPAAGLEEQTESRPRNSGRGGASEAC